MRPTLRFLEPSLIAQIVDEARTLLRTLGVTIQHQEVLTILGDHGAVVDPAKEHVRLTDEIMDQAVQTAPGSFRLYDVLGNQTHDFSGNNVHFTPGSGAINILETTTGKPRKPNTSDYIRCAKIMGGLEHVASQSTAFILGDIPESISDSYRLFLSFLYCEKPVVTGPFMTEASDVIRDLQLIVRGGEDELKNKPLAVLSCCPTEPIKWSHLTSQTLLDCARYSIPVELFSMPVSGSVAPATMAGALIQHTAETLSGMVIGQLASPGTPMLFGGSPASFDVRYQGTPLGGVVTMMIDLSHAEIGKWLGLPTQTHTSVSDTGRIGAKTELDSGAGFTLGALAGVNNISGPGMLEFGRCQSLETLVVDNDVCGMVLRMLKGLDLRDDLPALLLFRELPRKQLPFLETRLSYSPRQGLVIPQSDTNEADGSEWFEGGNRGLRDRATREVERLVREADPSRLSDDVKDQLVQRMEAEGRGKGIDILPSRGT